MEKAPAAAASREQKGGGEKIRETVISISTHRILKSVSN
jgi:hypothetical protein